jgi:hypothetical protein
MRRAWDASRLEQAFAAAALAAVPLKVAVDGGAPPILLSGAAALATLLGLAALVRPGERRWLDAWRLAFAALALWFLGDVYSRVGGDGYEYYATTRSLLFDFDLDYANEFAAFGATGVPGPEGEPTSRFPLGLSLLWVPGVVLTHLGVLLARAGGATLAADGLGVVYQSSATATSFALVVGGLLLTERLLRPRFGAAVAFLSVVSIWLATPLHFYSTANPSMSHGPASFLAALMLVTWLAAREGEAARGWLAPGLWAGAMHLVRIQDAAVLVMPAADRLLRGRRDLVRSLALLGAGVATAGLLQLAAWAALYGDGFIGQVRQGHFGPNRLHTLEVLFSARHGLFSWHPLYLFGVLGWLVGWRRERNLSLICLLGLVCSAGVNSLMSDWWGSDAFGQRRLVSLTPFFAIGVAQAVSFLRHRPLLPIAAGLLALVLWNHQFAYIFNSQMITGRHQAISLDRLAAAQVHVAARRWVRWGDWMPRRLWVLGYDLLEGIWLDEGPRSMRGWVQVGEDQPFPVVGHGWARPQTEDGERWFRRSNVPRSWLVLPIRTPGDYEVTLRIRSEMDAHPVRLTVELNGAAVGDTLLAPDWQETRFRIPEQRVQPGLNSFALRYVPTPAEVTPGFQGRNAAVALEWVYFDRLEGAVPRYGLDRHAPEGTAAP